MHFRERLQTFSLHPLTKWTSRLNLVCPFPTARHTSITLFVKDGLIYIPEIKYHHILNKAFGPGAWGLTPRTETNVGPKIVSREYALVCQGWWGFNFHYTHWLMSCPPRLVAIARGKNEYFDPSGIPTAAKGCKSNALMRCCKDLGIASELW